MNKDRRVFETALILSRQFPVRDADKMPMIKAVHKICQCDLKEAVAAVKVTQELIKLEKENAQYGLVLCADQRG